MNQYNNPQRFQPYTAPAGQQVPQSIPGGQPFYPGPGAQGFPQFPQTGTPVPPPPVQVPGMLPIEQSYIENILRLNKGKLAHVFATFEGNSQWNAKEFIGIIEAAGRDHVILSDPQSGQRFLIPMVALDYVRFDEEIEYDYPFGSAPSLGTYPPR